MNNLPQTMDLYVFIQVIKYQSFAKAAEEMGVSSAYISKRMKILEKTLGCSLVQRNTCSLKLTEKGEVVYQWGKRILADIGGLSETAATSPEDPVGSLFITSSLGFGRNHVATVLSALSSRYPKLDIRFDTIDKIPDLLGQQIDLDIRIGNSIAPNLIAKKIYANRRILCASPAYLRRHGTPKVLADLLHHQCLVIKERDHPFGIWKLNSAHGQQSIKVSGNLASNNGEIIRDWALLGHGIMLRSTWNIRQDMEHGKLVQILPDYWQEADVWAVFPTRLEHSPKLKACVEFFEQHLPQQLAGSPVC